MSRGVRPRVDYIKLGTRYYRDPAILAANKRTAGQAELLFLRALAQCGADEAEGQIPGDALLFLGVRNAPKVAAVLVEEGLWEESGPGWVIRSWEKWQSEHDALARRRKADRERKQKTRSKPTVGGLSTAASTGVHSGLSADSPPTGPQSSADRSRDSPLPNARDYRDRDRDRDQKQPERSTASAPARARASTKRATALPPDFALSGENAVYAHNRGMTKALAGREFEKFRSHHQAKGSTFKDWPAAWRTWVLRCADQPANATTPNPPDTWTASKERDREQAERERREQAEFAAEMGFTDLLKDA